MSHHLSGGRNRQGSSKELAVSARVDLELTKWRFQIVSKRPRFIVYRLGGKLPRW